VTPAFSEDRNLDHTPEVVTARPVNEDRVKKPN
jgi:hypothetical protein